MSAGRCQPVAPGTGDQSSPSERRYKKASSSASTGSRRKNTATFTGEPPRASLTDPPPGYQTPSPDQPYGIGRKESLQAATLGDRGWSRRDNALDREHALAIDGHVLFGTRLRMIRVMFGRRVKVSGELLI